MGTDFIDTNLEATASKPSDGITLAFSPLLHHAGSGGSSSETAATSTPICTK